MRHLDASLRDLSSYRMWRTNRVIIPRLNAVLADHGLRRTTFATLAIVVENPGLHQGAVAAALAIERPNFVQIVDELEKADLLSRERARDDKRAYALKATLAGVELYRKTYQDVRRYDQALTEGLSQSELDTLNKVLGVINANLKMMEAEDGS